MNDSVIVLEEVDFVYAWEWLNSKFLDDLFEFLVIVDLNIFKKSVLDFGALLYAFFLRCYCCYVSLPFSRLGAFCYPKFLSFRLHLMFVLSMTFYSFLLLFFFENF